MRIEPTGKVTVLTGKVEFGQNARTSLTQAVADELHVPVASIQLVMGDTEVVPFDMGTFGSRTTPTMAPVTTFLVEYGHLLIGLSLLFGLMVRVSAAFGVMLMIIYWFAHTDWPFIENKNNLIIDFHLVYAGVLVYLIVKRAGHVYGLDSWVENLKFIKQHPSLKPLVA